jgi:formyl-CoA transferase
MEDPHVRERGNLSRVADEELGDTVMQSVVPRLSHTPGGIRHAGPRRGEHNRDVFSDWLGMNECDIDGLREAGVV